MKAATCGRSSRVRRPKIKWPKPTELGDAFRMSIYRTTATLFALATTAIAVQTSPGLAFSSEAQQMCSGDAMRLCSSEIPDIPRITACMVRKKAEVSPGCRAVMDREHAAATGASRKREAAAQ
ncbi:hypothetical protein PMI42_01167 [Bradyrhizobium sp. YR681]|uniref:hypothetical protein n=1 Tax=Bradyrhizobium sp. YR681 TaxID=1144344 RepID=UPI0002713922|nr:hypothetical protein [Bradyrhizobium sp. YR681]EJN15229.1 hypothetical protein PMI42_01167 [Bradyrhizobium sp. YR681]